MKVKFQSCDNAVTSSRNGGKKCWNEESSVGSEFSFLDDSAF